MKGMREMKKLVLIIAATLFLSGCFSEPSIKEYPYRVGSETYCKRVDEEKRILYDCIQPRAGRDDNRVMDEIHLGANDSWIKR